MSDQRRGDQHRQGTKFIDAKRRGFLQGTALAAGSAATGGALAAEAAVAPAIETAAPAADAGYRETDHVRAYYASARN